jgi:PadR family transcriptional regulator, regulatory protein PadR
MNLKGSLPTLILQVLSREENHGYRIAQQIKQTSKGVLDFREGTLYPALHGLEQKGLIESDERTEQGRTRRYYRLTEHGRKTLAKERAEWARYAQAVSLIFKEA